MRHFLASLIYWLFVVVWRQFRDHFGNGFRGADVRSCF